MNAIARRMFELVEPIGALPYSADEPNETMFALGFTDYWDTYFAGRASPLGLAPAEVVNALFYNFAPGEVAPPAKNERLTIATRLHMRCLFDIFLTLSRAH